MRPSVDLPRCNTTREHALGIATVEVSANGMDFSTDGQNFEFVKVVISSVEPPTGPTLGGTAVTVRGSGLDALISTSLSGSGTHSFKCTWDNTVSPASVTVSGTVQCSIPPMKDHGMLCKQLGLPCSFLTFYLMIVREYNRVSAARLGRKSPPSCCLKLLPISSP